MFPHLAIPIATLLSSISCLALLHAATREVWLRILRTRLRDTDGDVPTMPRPLHVPLCFCAAGLLLGVAYFLGRQGGTTGEAGMAILDGFAYASALTFMLCGSIASLGIGGINRQSSAEMNMSIQNLRFAGSQPQPRVPQRVTPARYLGGMAAAGAGVLAITFAIRWLV